jgi:hypothetical protein
MQVVWTGRAPRGSALYSSRLKRAGGRLLNLGSWESISTSSSIRYIDEGHLLQCISAAVLYEDMLVH